MHSKEEVQVLILWLERSATVTPNLSHLIGLSVLQVWMACVQLPYLCAHTCASPIQQGSGALRHMAMPGFLRSPAYVWAFGRSLIQGLTAVLKCD